MSMLNFLNKNKPVIYSPATCIEQSVKSYCYGFMSTPMIAFQADVMQQAWNGWHVQSMQMMMGVFGWPELMVVYQREKGKVVIPLHETEMEGIPYE